MKRMFGFVEWSAAAAWAWEFIPKTATLQPKTNSQQTTERNDFMLGTFQVGDLQNEFAQVFIFRDDLELILHIAGIDLQGF